MGKARKKLLKVLLVVATMVAVLSFSITAFAAGFMDTVYQIPSNIEGFTRYQYVNLVGDSNWECSDIAGNTYFDFGDDKRGADSLVVGSGDTIYYTGRTDLSFDVYGTLNLQHANDFPVTVHESGTVVNNSNNTVIGAGGTLSIRGGATTASGNFAGIAVADTLKVTDDTTVASDITGEGTVFVADGKKLSFKGGEYIFQPEGAERSFNVNAKQISGTFTNLSGAWLMYKTLGDLTVNGGTSTITGSAYYGMTVNTGADVKCDPRSTFKWVAVNGGTVDLAEAAIDNDSDDENGGYGLYVKGGTVRATGERQYAEIVFGNKGGIYVEDGTITDFYKYNVRASVSGNALHVVNGTVELTDCGLFNLFKDNDATPVVLCDAGTTTISGGFINFNTGKHIAAQLSGGTLNLTNGVQVTSNHSVRAINVVGGILNVDGEETVINATTRIGICAQDAGVVNFEEGTMNITDAGEIMPGAVGIHVGEADAVANIKGGEINVTSNFADRTIYGAVAVVGTVNMSGGTLNVTGEAEKANACGAVAYEGAANITGGEINVTSEADNSKAYGAVAVTGAVNISGTGTIYVDGNGTNSYLYGVYVDELDAKATIAGAGASADAPVGTYSEVFVKSNGNNNYVYGLYAKDGELVASGGLIAAVVETSEVENNNIKGIVNSNGQLTFSDSATLYVESGNGSGNKAIGVFANHTDETENASTANNAITGGVIIVNDDDGKGIEIPASATGVVVDFAGLMNITGSNAIGVDMLAYPGSTLNFTDGTITIDGDKAKGINLNEGAICNFTGGTIDITGNNSYGTYVKNGEFVMGTYQVTELGSIGAGNSPYIDMNSAADSHGVYSEKGTSKIYNGSILIDGARSAAIYVAGGDVQVLTNLATPTFDETDAAIVFTATATGDSSYGFYAAAGSTYAIRGQGSVFSGAKGFYAANDKFEGNAPISGGTFYSFADTGNAMEVGKGKVANLLLANHYVRNDFTQKADDDIESAYTAATNGITGVDAKVAAVAMATEAGPYTVVDGEWELREAMELNHDDSALNDYTMNMDIILDFNAGKDIHGIYVARDDVDVEAGATKAGGHWLNVNGNTLTYNDGASSVMEVATGAELVTFDTAEKAGMITRNNAGDSAGYVIVVAEGATYCNGVGLHIDFDDVNANAGSNSAKANAGSNSATILPGANLTGVGSVSGIYNKGIVILDSGRVSGKYGIQQGTVNAAETYVYGGNLHSNATGENGFGAYIQTGDLIVDGGVIGAGPLDGTKELVASSKVAIHFASLLEENENPDLVNGYLIVTGGEIYGSGDNGVAIAQSDGVAQLQGGTIKGDYADANKGTAEKPVYTKDALHMVDAKAEAVAVASAEATSPLVLGTVHVYQGEFDLYQGNVKSADEVVLPTTLAGNLLVADGGSAYIHGGNINGETTVGKDSELLADSGHLMGNLLVNANAAVSFAKFPTQQEQPEVMSAKAEALALPVVHGITTIKDTAKFYVQNGIFNIVEASIPTAPMGEAAIGPDVQLHGGMYSQIKNITENDTPWNNLGWDIRNSNLVPANHYLVLGVADGDTFVADKDAKNPRMDQASLNAGEGKKIGVVYAGNEIRTMLAKGNYTLPCDIDLGEEGACNTEYLFRAGTDIIKCGDFETGTLKVTTGNQVLDLNNYMLTYVGADANNPNVLINGGSLTIDDNLFKAEEDFGAIVTDGFFATNPEGANNAVQINSGNLLFNCGDLFGYNSGLQINGGTIKIADGLIGGINNGIEVSSDAKTADLTVTGGYIVGMSNGLGVANGKVALNGGSFIGFGERMALEKSADVADVAAFAKVATLAANEVPEIPESWGLAVTPKEGSSVVINGGTFSNIKNTGSTVGALIASNHSVWDNTDTMGVKEYQGKSEVVAFPFLNATDKLNFVATYDADKDPATPNVEYNTCYTVVYNGGGGTGPINPVNPGKPVTPPTKPALDTENHFAYILGNADGTFDPNGNLTRSQASAMFYRLLKDQSYTGNVAFKDVGFEYWAHNEILSLANKNILSGYADGRFIPGGKITRAELCAMASRFFNLTPGEINYTDVPKDHWAYDFIASAAAKGWVDAGATTFRPNDYITRAEAVCIINKMLNRSADKEYVDKNLSASFPDVAKTSYYYYDVMEAAHGHLYTMKDNVETWTELK